MIDLSRYYVYESSPQYVHHMYAKLLAYSGFRAQTRVLFVTWSAGRHQSTASSSRGLPCTGGPTLMAHHHYFLSSLSDCSYRQLTNYNSGVWSAGFLRNMTVSHWHDKSFPGIRISTAALRAICSSHDHNSHYSTAAQFSQHAYACAVIKTTSSVDIISFALYGHGKCWRQTLSSAVFSPVL